jgi:CTP synthase
MPEQEKKLLKKEYGATMRLGAWDCKINPKTLAHKLYGKSKITERHRHRFEFNNEYRQQLEKAGLIFSGTTPDNQLVEIIELKDHPYFIASQFHPEFLSRPNKPAPLFDGLIKAIKRIDQNKESRR